MMKHFFTPEFKVTYSGGWEFKMRSLEHCTVALQNVNWGSISRFRLLYRNEGYFCRLITERSSSTFLKPLSTHSSSHNFQWKPPPTRSTLLDSSTTVVQWPTSWWPSTPPRSSRPIGLPAQYDIFSTEMHILYSRHLIECLTVVSSSTIKNVPLSCFKDLKRGYEVSHGGLKP